MAGGYPIVLNVAGKRCVIAGGGAVAERKAAGLLEAGADVIIVAPALSPLLREWASGGAVRAEEREYRESDLAGAALVFAATDRADVNRRVAADAQALGIWANVADDGDAGDFMTPAVVRRGELLLAASASGAGPALAARIARELAARYGEEYAAVAAALRKLRAAAKASVGDAAERRRLLAAAAGDEALALWRALPADEPAERLLERLRALAGQAGAGPERAAGPEQGAAPDAGLWLSNDNRNDS